MLGMQMGSSAADGKSFEGHAKGVVGLSSGGGGERETSGGSSHQSGGSSGSNLRGPDAVGYTSEGRIKFLFAD